ncbi:Trk system potassium transporter TrkA [Eubacteriales bacterium OttesenSCG-928-M02]|nr:Trk system potassium transporter TrkA [Eubacteriales bacterium OttesenSCG-928-M02]
MKVIVFGGGKTGFTLAEELTDEGHDLLVVDTNRDALLRISEQLDVMTLLGNGASLLVQREADVAHSDLVIATTASDEVNLLCCIIARRLGAKHTIVRMRNPEYSEQLAFLKDELGLSLVLNPELVAAREIFRLLQLPSFLKRDSFADGRVEIVEIHLKENSPLVGKALKDVGSVLHARMLVCAVQREGEVIIPGGDFVLLQGDKIYVTAPVTELGKLIKGLGIPQKRIRDVMLIGGSRISYYLSRFMIEAGIEVTILESNRKRCMELAEALPKANIINEDGSVKQVLLSEGIEKADAVIPLTNIDEINLLISMYANYINVPKVITKINRTEFIEVFLDKGIDCIVSPKTLTANDIVQYVRAMYNTVGGSVLTVHRLVDDQVEALEFNVTKDNKYLGKSLREIPVKPNILIACINRGRRPIIPQGSDTIEMGDTLVVVATTHQKIFDLNDIFMD